MTICFKSFSKFFMFASAWAMNTNERKDAAFCCHQPPKNPPKLSACQARHFDKATSSEKRKQLLLRSEKHLRSPESKNEGNALDHDFQEKLLFTHKCLRLATCRLLISLPPPKPRNPNPKSEQKHKDDEEMNTLQRKKKVAPTQETTNNALESKIRLPTLCCQPRHTKNPNKNTQKNRVSKSKRKTRETHPHHHSSNAKYYGQDAGVINRQIVGVYQGGDIGPSRWWHTRIRLIRHRTQNSLTLWCVGLARSHTLHCRLFTGQLVRKQNPIHTLNQRTAPQEDGTSSLHMIGPNDVLSRGLRSLLTGPQRFLVGISKCARGRREGKGRGRS